MGAIIALKRQRKLQRIDSAAGGQSKCEWCSETIPRRILRTLIFWNPQRAEAGSVAQTRRYVRTRQLGHSFALTSTKDHFFNFTFRCFALRRFQNGAGAKTTQQCGQKQYRKWHTFTRETKHGLTKTSVIQWISTALYYYS